MPKKHLRDDTDIGHLAEELAGRWQKGDGVEPWLRSLEPELSRKVQVERWSWKSIAQALNLAGILYQTGKEWTGVSLSKKIATVRYDNRHQARRHGETSQPSLLPPASPFSSPAVPIARIGQPVPAFTNEVETVTEDEEPEFQPAFLKGWSGTKIVREEQKPSETKTPPAQPQTGDASEVIARLLGKK